VSGKLELLLSGCIPPGVYRWPSRATTARISARILAQVWAFALLEGKGITTKTGFLTTISRTLRFPSYFGGNWDALEECLHDLSWLPVEHGRLLLYERAGCFQKASPEQFATAVKILQSAVEHWRTTAAPMAVLLRGLGRGFSGCLPEL
jgi:RNAse (barnase) inhibitor barstar